MTAIVSAVAACLTVAMGASALAADRPYNQSRRPPERRPDGTIVGITCCRYPHGSRGGFSVGAARFTLEELDKKPAGRKGLDEKATRPWTVTNPLAVSC